MRNTMRTLIGSPLPFARIPVNPIVHRTIIQHLKLQDANYREARRQRSTAAVGAREVGLTNQEIGTVFGVTEAAVRAMIKKARAEDEN